MIKGLNTKGLCKMIQESKHRIIWFKEDGVYYITNRSWAIKFDIVPRDVLIKLFSITAAVPEEGQALVMASYLDEPLVQVPPNMKDIFDTALKGVPAQRTSFIKSDEKLLMRIFKTDKEKMFIDEKYLQLVDFKSYEGEIIGSGRMSPIIFKEMNYLVLPYRLTNDAADHSVIEELIKE